MELFRALAALAEPPSVETARVACALELPSAPMASEYTDLFVFELYPYASVYLGAEGMLGGEARDRIAGFWRALGLVPPSEADHLSLMLALYARLCELEADAGELLARERWRTARKAFLWEHLLSWLPVYLAKMEEVGSEFYKSWGRLLRAALLEEARRLGMQAQLSLHLRESLAVRDPRGEDGADFLSSLLAPARSGMILVRADLVRAARGLGLGLRLGERRFVLKSLLGQDAAGVLGWLAAEAASWSARHRAERETLAETAAVWENRATATARLLLELKAESVSAAVASS